MKTEQERKAVTRTVKKERVKVWRVLRDEATHKDSNGESTQKRVKKKQSNLKDWCRFFKIDYRSARYYKK